MIRIRLLILVQIFSSISSGICQGTDAFDWKKPEYCEAYAYMYALDKEGNCGLIIQNDALNESAIDKNGIKINNETLNDLLDIIANQSNMITPDEGTFYSFSPHHGIIFFNRNKEPIAYITVDFIRGYIIFSPDNEYYNNGLVLFKDLFESLGYPVFNRPEFYYGYSRQFKNGVNTKEIVYTYNDIEVKPEFNYNNLTFSDYLEKNLINTISDSTDFDKYISFSFVVEQNGEITFPEINYGKNDQEDKLLLIALNVMPNWNPGKIGNSNCRVRVDYTVYLKEK